MQNNRKDMQKKKDMLRKKQVFHLSNNNNNKNKLSLFVKKLFLNGKNKKNK